MFRFSPTKIYLRLQRAFPETFPFASPCGFLLILQHIYEDRNHLKQHLSEQPQSQQTMSPGPGDQTRYNHSLSQNILTTVGAQLAQVPGGQTRYNHIS